MTDQTDIKRINVYIPFIEIYLQLEIKITSKLQQLAEIIHKVTSNDNELNIFRYSFKYIYLIQIQRTIAWYESSDIDLLIYFFIKYLIIFKNYFKQVYKYYLNKNQQIFYETTLAQIEGITSGDPKCYLTAYAEMTGA